MADIFVEAIRVSLNTAIVHKGSRIYLAKMTVGKLDMTTQKNWPLNRQSETPRLESSGPSSSP